MGIILLTWLNINKLSNLKKNAQIHIINLSSILISIMKNILTLSVNQERHLGGTGWGIYPALRFMWTDWFLRADWFFKAYIIQLYKSESDIEWCHRGHSNSCDTYTFNQINIGIEPIKTLPHTKKNFKLSPYCKSIEINTKINFNYLAYLYID